MEGKESYSVLDCPHKIRLQERFLPIFSKCKETHVLGGPPKSIYDHILRLRKLKVHNITSYEYYKDIYTAQIGTLIDKKIRNVKLVHGDILNAPNKDNVGLELDFCLTIDKFLEHVRKFTSRNTIFVFSLRTGKRDGKNADKPIGWFKDYTISTFFKERNEKILNRTENPGLNDIYISTNKGNYIIATYRDSTAMIMIVKI